MSYWLKGFTLKPSYKRRYPKNYQHHVPVIDKTVQKTREWLKEICHEIGYVEEQKAYSILRAVLHALRDRLSIEESAHLASQLPTLIRGMYYDGWKPSKVPGKERSTQDFLDLVYYHMGPSYSDEDLNLRRATKKVFQVLSRHVSEGQLHDIKSSLPSGIRELFVA